MRVLDPLIENTPSFVLRNITIGNVYTVSTLLEGTNNGFTDTYTADNNLQLTISISVDDYKENDSVSIKIVENTSGNVAYRGKLFFTSQTPQNYNING